MKRKTKGVFGIALVVLLLASLTVGLAVPAGADPGTLKFTTLALPQVGPDGGYWAYPDSNVGPIATSPDGDTLFAAVDDGGGTWDLMKSTDGGYAWRATGFTNTALIVDVAVSPDYADDTTVFAATGDYVYQSVDGGAHFFKMNQGWGAGAAITDLDVTLDERGRLAVMVGTTDATQSAATADITILAGVTVLDLGLNIDGVEISLAYTDTTAILVATKIATASFATVDVTRVDAVLTFTHKVVGAEGNRTVDMTDPNYSDGTVPEITLTGGDADTKASANIAIPAGVTELDLELTIDGAVITLDYGNDAAAIAAAIALVLTSDFGNTTNATADGAVVTFTAQTPGVAGNITVTLTDGTYSGGTVPEITLTGGLDYTGDVYILSTKTGMTWLAQGIGNYDVLVAAFSPFFADDEGIVAVVTDVGAEKTLVRFAFANTSTGGGWEDDIGDASVKDAKGYDYSSSGACIGFPDDFDPWGIGNNVCFVGTKFAEKLSDGIATAGDVYKITLKAGPSSATDLNIRGVVTTLQPTETDIFSIDVCGDAEAANILVGTADTVYRSDDGGGAWSKAGKSPTGTSAQVLMSPDFLTSGIAYAATSGDASAFSRTTDSGNSWNQISLIDYAADGYTIAPLGFNAAGYNADGTLYMVTQVSGADGAVWKRTGGHWERIYYAANNVSQVIVNGDETMFAVDYSARKIYRSSDMGATWPKTITTKSGHTLSAVCVVSPTTLYTGYTDGSIYYSTKSGVGWTPPKESDVTDPVVSISVNGDVVLVSTADGGVFISSDCGETVKSVGAKAPGKFASFDVDFTDNGIIYAAGTDGVWGATVDLDNPAAAEWSQKKAISANSPAITLPPSGILYVTDGTAVGADSNGGLWRSAGTFEQVIKGLDDGDSVGLVDADVFPTVLFFLNTTTYKQVLVYSDTLDSPVTLASPADGAAGVGDLYVGQFDVKAALVWEKMSGATSYQYQVALDEDFNTVVKDDFTPGQLAPLALSPNATYYWKVRVAENTSTATAPDVGGAPLFTPWSETWKFKTAIGATAARPALQAPGAGATDVALSPTFEWSGIGWAEAYEFELATDPATTAGGYFSTPLKALVGTDALVSTAWKCDTTLDYEGRYYWHVKAIGVDTETPWSDVGTFVTMGEAPPPPETQPPVVVEQPDVITPAWIWAIVIIGAILVIAVITLIVTTRRTP